MKVTDKFNIPAPWDKILPWTSGVFSVLSIGSLCYYSNIYFFITSFIKNLDPTNGKDLFLLMVLLPFAFFIGLFLLLLGIALVFILLRLCFSVWTLITGTIFVGIGFKLGYIYLEKEAKEKTS